MSEDLQMIFNVTVKLEEALHDINKMLADHIKNKKSDKSIKSSGTDKNASNSHSQKEQKKQANVKKLKKPAGPFLLFCNEQREVIKKSYPQMKPTQVSQNLGKIWQNLSAQDKRPYQQRSQKALQKFYQEHPQQRHKSHKKKKQ